MLNFFQNSGRNFSNRGHRHIIDGLDFHDWKRLRRLRPNNQGEVKYFFHYVWIPPDWSLDHIKSHSCCITVLIAYWFKAYVIFAWCLESKEMSFFTCSPDDYKTDFNHGSYLFQSPSVCNLMSYRLIKYIYHLSKYRKANVSLNEWKMLLKLS